MKSQKFYKLPELAYNYDALSPAISEELLRLHHKKHHAAYVDGANAILRMMDEARSSRTEFDVTAGVFQLSLSQRHLTRSMAPLSGSKRCFLIRP